MLAILTVTSPINVEEYISQAYRPEIDGIRAISVFAVLVYHFTPSWIPGGFIGVDFFFVISGYVVTRSLNVDLGSKRWSTFFLEFYARRAKRIFPPLLVCVVCTMLAYAALSPPFPDEANNSAYRTAMASLLGVGNLYLIKRSAGYFDGNSYSNPMLHTWSLGVEEQFYFIFPTILAFGFFASKPFRRAHGTAIITAIFVCGSLLFAFSDWRSNSTISYYSPLARFWEIGTGSLIAQIQGVRPAIGNQSKLLATLLATLGMIGMALATLVTPVSGMPFPSAIGGVLSVSALIIADSSHNLSLINLLRCKLMTYLGKISYSTYLWHWPIVVLLSLTDAVSPHLKIIIGITLAYCLSSVSFRWIEKPTRHSRISTRSLLSVSFCSIVLSIGILEVIRQNRSNLFLGPSQDWYADWNFARGDHFFPGKTSGECVRGVTSESIAPCTMPASVPLLPNLYLIGDSHAFSNWSMVKGVVDENLYNLISFTHDGCSITADFHEARNSCERYWQEALQMLRTKVSQNDIVFVAVNARAIKDANLLEPFFKVLSDSIGRATLVLQNPPPVLDGMGFSCLEGWISPDKSKCTKDRETDLTERKPVVLLFQKIANDRQNIAIWDPHPILCPGIKCSHFLNKKPLIRDDDHLSLYGSRYLAPHFANFVRNLKSPSLSH